MRLSAHCTQLLSWGLLRVKMIDHLHRQHLLRGVQRNLLFDPSCWLGLCIPWYAQIDTKKTADTRSSRDDAYAAAALTTHECRLLVRGSSVNTCAGLALHVVYRVGQDPVGREGREVGRLGLEQGSDTCDTPAAANHGTNYAEPNHKSRAVVCHAVPALYHNAGTAKYMLFGKKIYYLISLSCQHSPHRRENLKRVSVEPQAQQRQVR